MTNHWLNKIAIASVITFLGIWTVKAMPSFAEIEPRQQMTIAQNVPNTNINNNHNMGGDMQEMMTHLQQMTTQMQEMMANMTPEERESYQKMMGDNMQKIMNQMQEMQQMMESHNSMDENHNSGK